MDISPLQIYREPAGIPASTIPAFMLEL